jgi:hypothetical protein
MPGFKAIATCALALSFACALTASTVQMKFVGVNGAQTFGNYVGPYYGTLDGEPVELFCVDFANEVTFGQQWDANLTSVGADLSDTRYGSVPGAVELYRQAAWLTSQYASQPAGEYGDIQATIWRLFSASAPVPSSSYWSEQAAANFAAMDYTDFRIVTNLAPVLSIGQVQEFLIRTQTSPAPEPNTQVSLGLALVGVSWLWRKVHFKSGIS